MTEPEASAKRIRLTGSRFDGGRLPVDYLIELERYQNAIRSFAEHEWLRDHPGESLPADFRDSVSLVIEDIEDGSAEIVLVFEQTAIHQEYREQAQDAIDSTIEAAYQGTTLPELPDDVEDEVRGTIAELGSTLQVGQSMVLYSADADEPPVTITIDTRPAAAGRLILQDFLSEPPLTAASGVTHEETSMVARVTVVDAERKRFELNSEKYGRILGRYAGNPEILDSLREVVNSTSDGPLTRIYGDLRSKDGEPWGFWTTSRIERIEFDDTAWGRALTSFVTLPSGWADGRGEQISSIALDAAQQLLRQVDVQIRPPSLAPTEEGGVLLEWITPSGIRSVEILEDGLFELFSMRTGERRGTQTETRNLKDAVRFAKEDET
ncbi:hypothetical protein [Microbacterium jejuense]|uniref:hypothetical protein n=1 Tax=Microbacterium jejuense TaxID=1263637 RepID=UPI0031EDCA6E